jgi:hypothetical protein
MHVFSFRVFVGRICLYTKQSASDAANENIKNRHTPETEKNLSAPNPSRSIMANWAALSLGDMYTGTWFYR